jgi:Holliday junction resolvase RusA-like endonuclease
MTIRFTVFGVAAPQGSHKGFVNRRTGRVIITQDSKRTRPWRDLVALVAQEHAPAVLLDGAIAVRMDFYLPRPKSLPKRVEHCTKKPDVSKLLRAAEDALTGILWTDDSRIIDAHIRKLYGDPPRVEIEVSETPLTPTSPCATLSSREPLGSHQAPREPDPDGTDEAPRPGNRPEAEGHPQRSRSPRTTQAQGDGAPRRRVNAQSRP